jgi:DNA polymerase-3 subunit delta'
MLFRQVVGHNEIKKGLVKMHDTNRLPHALLLAGQEGTGGLPLAMAFAQLLFCTNRQEFDSCGDCPGCRKASRLEHPDLHISFPAFAPKQGAKALSRHFITSFREFFVQSPYGTTYDWLQFIDAENKQGNIPAEECREIIDTLNLKSYEGGKKIQIIWRPEYLGKEGNILLKLIEEPPADTLILMVAENPNEVLPTILSRTQMVRLGPIPPADIAQGLSDRSLADPKRAVQVAHIAGGSFTEALRLIRHTDNDLFPEVRRWFNGLFKNNGIELSKFSEDWSKAGREQQKNFLQYVIQLLEQAMRARYLPGKPLALPEEEADFVGKLGAMTLPDEVIHKMVEAISRTIYYIERNAHSKTQLHALSIGLVYIIQNKPSPVL